MGLPSHKNIWHFKKQHVTNSHKSYWVTQQRLNLSLLSLSYLGICTIVSDRKTETPHSPKEASCLSFTLERSSLSTSSSDAADDSSVMPRLGIGHCCGKNTTNKKFLAWSILDHLCFTNKQKPYILPNNLGTPHIKESISRSWLMFLFCSHRVTDHHSP